MFDDVIAKAAWWWCTHKQEYPPDEGSDLFVEKSRKAVRHLLEEIPNASGLSVLQYATSLCAIDVLQRIFALEKIYRVTHRDRVEFDVTNLAPQSLDQSLFFAQKRNSKVRPASASVGPSDDVIDASRRELLQEQSCLDIVVEMPDEIVANTVLDVVPFSFLIVDYWSIYRIIYFILMVVHLTNMSLFSAFSVPLAQEVWSRNGTEVDTSAAYGVFLVWPLIVLLFTLVFGSVQLLSAWRRRKQSRSGLKSNSDFFENLFVFYWFMSNLGSLTAIAFGVLTVVWFVMYLSQDPNQVYVLAVNLVLGWLYSIHFTKGFKTVHAFSIMLKHIIIRDMTRFLFIYAFVLFGFAFAMNALFQISLPVREALPTGWHALFTTFNMMIGMDEIFDEDTDENYSSVGSSSVYLRLVYLIYIILATIILLNLLIAMMSDTYNEVKSREGTTWRVGSIGMAVRIERSLPLVSRMLRATRNWQARFPVQQNDPPFGRYHITVKRKDLHRHLPTQDSEVSPAWARLENRLNALSDELSKLIEAQQEAARHHDGADDVTSSRPPLKNKVSSI